MTASFVKYILPPIPTTRSSSLCNVFTVAALNLKSKANVYPSTGNERRLLLALPNCLRTARKEPSPLCAISASRVRILATPSSLGITN